MLFNRGVVISVFLKARCILPFVLSLWLQASEGEVFTPIVERGGTIFIGLLCKSTRGLVCSDFTGKGSSGFLSLPLCLLNVKCVICPWRRTTTRSGSQMDFGADSSSRTDPGRHCCKTVPGRCMCSRVSWTQDLKFIILVFESCLPCLDTARVNSNFSPSNGTFWNQWVLWEHINFYSEHLLNWISRQQPWKRQGRIPVNSLKSVWASRVWWISLEENPSPLESALSQLWLKSQYCQACSQIAVARISVYLLL